MQRFQFVNIKILPCRFETPPADVPPLAARAVALFQFAQTHPQRLYLFPPDDAFGSRRPVTARAPRRSLRASGVDRRFTS